MGVYTGEIIGAMGAACGEVPSSADPAGTLEFTLPSAALIAVFVCRCCQHQGSVLETTIECDANGGPDPDKDPCCPVCGSDDLKLLRDDSGAVVMRPFGRRK